MIIKEKQLKIRTIVEKQPQFLSFTPKEFTAFITVAENQYGFSGKNGIDVRGKRVTPIDFRNVNLNQEDGVQVIVKKPELKELFGKPALAVTYRTIWKDQRAYAGKKEYANSVYFNEDGIYGGIIPNIKSTPQQCKYSTPDCETLWKDYQNFRKEGWEYVGDIDFTHVDQVKERKLLHGVLFNLATPSEKTDTKKSMPDLIK